jgi:hypothetical protein
MPFARLSDNVTHKTLKLFCKPRRSSLRYLRFLLLLFIANRFGVASERISKSAQSLDLLISASSRSFAVRMSFLFTAGRAEVTEIRKEMTKRERAR